ncbi:MAG: hypothetical protein EDS66_09105 [Planctomycetota bacterium]|nr:MAG: hypothetical protein EDS66_09105 [Planctomycetota bacterium]
MLAIAAVAARLSQPNVTGAEPADATKVAASVSEFPRSTIDLGVAVSDLDESLKFYTEAIGFTAKSASEAAGIGPDS